jgi:hypothetical protein
MLVLTDGNENTAPFISTLPPGTINQTTFAIGFGLPGQVSDPVLSQISMNSGGYLLVTGNMTTDDERFKLAKFFIQVLKDATRNQTVVDPEGLLLWNGQPQEIPFQISDTEVSIDVVTLCPIPLALDFRLVTPSGQIITPDLSGVEPNVRYVIGPEVVYYRLMLPVFPGNPGGSQRGTWKALLRLKPWGEVLEDIKKNRGNDVQVADILRRMREFAERAVPYNLTVHAYSNLILDALLHQSSFAPGATARLTVNLLEYQLPLREPTNVWAEVLEPGGSRGTLPLVATSTGSYAGNWVLSRSGVYQFVVRAEGRTSGNSRFTRAKVLTAGVWAGGDQPYNPQTGAGSEFCNVIRCLLDQVGKSRVLQERLKELGIDLEALIKCIKAHCERDAIMSERSNEITARDVWSRLTEMPEFHRLVTVLSAGGMRDLPLLEAGKAAPVARAPKREGTQGNLFVLPDENGHHEGGHNHDHQHNDDNEDDHHNGEEHEPDGGHQGGRGRRRR